MELLSQHRSSILSGLLALVLACGTVSGARTQDPVDRVAAVVEDSIVTYSEILWLIRYRGFPLPDDPAEVASLCQEVLSQLINQKLITRETLRTPFINVTDNELENYLTLYKQRFPGEEGYRAKLAEIGIGEEDFLSMIRRQIIVNKFIELRFEPFIIVLPAEIDAYYKDELIPELQLNNQPVPELPIVEETIRQILSVRKTTQELERWVRATRDTARVQLLLDREPSRAPNLPAEFLEESNSRPAVPIQPTAPQ